MFPQNKSQRDRLPLKVTEMKRKVSTCSKYTATMNPAVL